MARTKSTRSQSKSRSQSQSRSPKSGRMARQSSERDEGFSVSRVRDTVENNMSLQTAGLALAGAGLLALVSSSAGRNLIRTAANSMARFASDNLGGVFGSSEEREDEDFIETRRRPSRQNREDRLNA